MNLTVYGIECAAAVVLFTAAIMIPLCRNPVWWIHDYPADIQEKYFATHERIPVQMLSAPVLLKKGFALVLCLSAFLASYGLWLVIDWYDCFVLDWVLFANIKRIRLPGTEQMDRAYHQKKYHAVRSAIGMVLGLLPCLLCGLIVMQVA